MLSVLLVDDDRVGRRMLVEGLTGRFACVEQVETAEAMFDRLDKRLFEVVVLDVSLPGIDGITAASRLRARSDVGLILISVIRDARTRLSAIEAGADAYLVKPVMARELAARVQTLGGRVAAARGCEAVAPLRPVLGDIELDMHGHMLQAGSRHEVLTPGETDLLVSLLAASGAPCPREHLLQSMSHSDCPAVGNRTVDTLIARLRCKLRRLGAPGDCIRSVRGVGYRLVNAA